MVRMNEPPVNIYYSQVNAALFDKIWIAASKKGICCLRFDADPAAFITNLAISILSDETPSIIQDNKKTSAYRAALVSYLNEGVPIPDDLPVDLHQLTGFQQEILKIVRSVPMGASITYGEIAEKIDNPNASRAIGQVLRRNPIPIIIPCHRVLNADGTLGGYGGVMGSERKIMLLKHEGVILA